MKKTERKLIRDRIPELIKQAGKDASIGTYDEAGFKKALLLKLIEEATEASAATSDNELIEELADALEVIDSIVETYSLNRAEIQSVQEEKRQLRGTFKRRYYLDIA